MTTGKKEYKVRGKGEFAKCRLQFGLFELQPGEEKELPENMHSDARALAKIGHAVKIGVLEEC